VITKKIAERVIANPVRVDNPLLHTLRHGIRPLGFW
jgi:hypothetical protein